MLDRLFIVAAIAFAAGVSLACTSAKQQNSVQAAAVDLMPSPTESNSYVVVRVEFSNDGAERHTVASYSLDWPGGSKVVSKRFDVDGGAAVSRTVRVTYKDGDIAKLALNIVKVTAR